MCSCFEVLIRKGREEKEAVFKTVHKCVATRREKPADLKQVNTILPPFFFFSPFAKNYLSLHEFRGKGVSDIMELPTIAPKPTLDSAIGAASAVNDMVEKQQKGMPRKTAYMLAACFACLSFLLMICYTLLHFLTSLLENENVWRNIFKALSENKTLH